jgi:hypothetical protein
MLRLVVAPPRDDTALQNWGIIWMLSSLSNGAGFLATHVLLSRGEFGVKPYLAVWAIVFTLNGAFMVFLKKKSAGPRSFIERQIWSIWNTCIAGMGLAAVVNYLMGLSTMLFMPAVTCIVAAMTFSIMGALMGRWWYLPAGVWAALAIVLALLPRMQFALLAPMWTITQGGAGLLLHRARLRAEAARAR